MLEENKTSKRHLGARQGKNPKWCINRTNSPLLIAIRHERKENPII